MKSKVIVVGVVVVTMVLLISLPIMAMTFSVSATGSGTLKVDECAEVKTNNTYARYQFRVNAIQAESYALQQIGTVQGAVNVETEFEYSRNAKSLICGVLYVENVGSGIWQDVDETDCKECSAGLYASARHLEVRSQAAATPTLMEHDVEMLWSGTKAAVGYASLSENGSVEGKHQAYYGDGAIKSNARCERVLLAAQPEATTIKAICPWPKGRSEANNGWRVFAAA